MPLPGVRSTVTAKVTSYHLIPADSYDDLVKWIKRQMGILRSQRSVPMQDDAWRNSRIRAIKFLLLKPPGGRGRLQGVHQEEFQRRIID